LLALGKVKVKEYAAHHGEWMTTDLDIRTNQILPSGGGFQVQFDPYEIDCFAAGAPIITYSAAEASRIFRAAPLTQALFGAR